MNKVERINLDDYTQTGEGGTSLTYTSKDGKRLAKLYNPGYEADLAKEDFLTACTVYDLGIPSPKPYRLITDGVRVGAEYEWIQGKRSFARIISEQPERLEELSVEFAQRSLQLHTTEADTQRLRSTKQMMKRFYLEREVVADYYKQSILRFLDTVPEQTTCLHGDLQIGNIITDGKRTLWIDLGGFGYGVPEWDLAFTWRMTHNSNTKITEWLLHLTSDVLDQHWHLFLQNYLGTTDRQRIEEATRKLLPYAAAKLPYMFYVATRKTLPEEMLKPMYKMFE